MWPWHLQMDRNICTFGNMSTDPVSLTPGFKIIQASSLMCVVCWYYSVKAVQRWGGGGLLPPLQLSTGKSALHGNQTFNCSQMLRLLGRAAMCDSGLFERRINSQPLIKTARTPGRPGVERLRPSLRGRNGNKILVCDPCRSKHACWLCWTDRQLSVQSANKESNWLNDNVWWWLTEWRR